MAKIKFGMIVTDGRGKIGGQVLSKNRAGSYIRTKVTPVNPQTTFQTSARALFGSISQLWSALTASQRAGWNGAVSDWQKTDIFGDLKLPSGKALFQRLNNQAQSAGYPAVTTAPARLEMVSGVVETVAVVISGPDITPDGMYTGANARVMMFATAPLSQGTTFVKDQLRNVYNAQGSTFSNADAYTAYVAKFGAPTAGANIYFGFKYVLANGQASPMQIIKGTVAA